MLTRQERRPWKSFQCLWEKDLSPTAAGDAQALPAGSGDSTSSELACWDGGFGGRGRGVSGLEHGIGPLLGPS